VRITAFGIIGSEDHHGGWDRQCGEPLYLLLVCAGSWQNRSDDRATLDGLKLSRLSSGLVSDRACFGRSLSRKIPSGQNDPDAPTSVSVHRDLPHVLTYSEGCGALS
jgi:hypothetical protein